MLPYVTLSLATPRSRRRIAADGRASEGPYPAVHDQVPDAACEVLDLELWVLVGREVVVHASQLQHRTFVHVPVCAGKKDANKMAPFNTVKLLHAPPPPLQASFTFYASASGG